MCETDVLDQLKPYFKDGVNVNDLEKIKELHDVFHADFFDHRVVVDDIPIKVKPYKYKGGKRENMPEEYSEFYEKFVHVITREKKASNRKTAPTIREFREERANRVHWIRPILENCNDKRITRFTHTNYSKMRQREYFWYRGKDYIVIVEYIRPDYALITGFCVDSDNRAYYQNLFINRDK